MAQTITKGIKSLLAEADKVVPRISVEEAKSHLGNEDFVFVDLRDPREIKREGKIPGAFSCTRGMLEFWIDPDSPYHKEIFNQDKTYVFYCASSWRSALAGKTARDMGMRDVIHVDGGFSQWKKEGADVEAAG
ncbi:rhodanese-like domain-containing protein [uncultured Roseobacter sp.]|uniref:rhodanese-like domain-containing protein n=1 Tax=uncultured Roseobacter sp. TaxID=114847 RepID=UPI002615254F|nr:rhodanese-like domain-containing protein [uncultured Roseobacter sp.]